MRLIAVLVLAAVAGLTGCADTETQFQPKVASTELFSEPASPAPAAGADMAALEAKAGEIQDIALLASQGVPVSDRIAGPGLVMGLGHTVEEVRIETTGGLEAKQFGWAGCPAGCAELDTRGVFAALASDLSAPEAELASQRIVGKGASPTDPRIGPLKDLPAVVVHYEDTAQGKWRSWYLMLSDQGGLVGVIGETGSLS